MKFVSSLILCFFLLAGTSFAHAIDGQWVAEREVQRGALSMKMSQTFNLKAAGKKLTGTVVVTIDGQSQPPIEIKEGKIEGSKFSFHTVAVSKAGDLRSAYVGEVAGNMIKGKTTRGGPSAPFEAKRK